ncbi:MAG TPA: hypothetical protein VHU14_05870 [Solirubrobacterales bacterium]|nr:hypothetical protein [Solirubrobacterales bacterium]
MKRLLASGALIVCVLLTGGASAALVKTGNLVLTADGGFTPRDLPRRAFAPIDFEGHADLKAVGGGVPPPLQQLELEFDRNGRLSTAGLPICQPSQLEEATPAEARNRCREAIVGTGHVGALIALGTGAPTAVSSLMTLFNGPPREGHPTVILHARTTVPAVQTFVITIPIEERGGLYRYRAIIDVPPIAGGLGSLTHLDVKVGRRYRFRGTERSYVAARCGSGIFRTHGRFTFAEGLIIYGEVEKACSVR